MSHEAARSSASLRSTDHQFGPLTPNSPDVERTPCAIDTPPPSYTKVKCQDDLQRQTRSCVQDRLEREPGLKASSASLWQSIPEQLADLIRLMVGGAEGEELGLAFQDAADFPPITKQSLSELDLNKIIENLKLRHDINFDRDLSFRPNLDGSRGDKKRRQASMYWKALVAELRLYVRIFQCDPSFFNHDTQKQSKFVEGAKRRIPNMFETIRDVLKSLVPVRDHPRVDEHLDVEKLMQEIERGVCDLVRLAEWLALLLKEHCAPMRDELVDKMVETTGVGVAQNSSEQIIGGLRDLFGILEAMKLDVANHQIRNLKTMLIEDTINFERHYHLGRIVHGQARVNVEAACRWYSIQIAQFQYLRNPSQKRALPFQLEVFVRATASSLLSNNSHVDLPDTFYLDYDRLGAIKLELTDIVYFEMCFDFFSQLLQELSFHGPIPLSTRHQLRTSLWAIITETAGFGSFQWLSPHSEHIAVEIVRQAAELTRSPHLYNHEVIDRTHQRLRTFFLSNYEVHAQTVLKAHLVPQLLDTVSRHMHSSPIELFNNLTTSPDPVVTPALSMLTAAPPPPPPSLFPERDDVAAIPLLSPTAADQIADIARKVAHVALLHWRTWGPIAYVVEGEGKEGSPEDVQMRG